MNKQRFKQLLGQTDFQTLFIEEMGWNYPASRNAFPLQPIDETVYELQPLAERSGFQVFTCHVDTLPLMSTCRKFDTRLRPLAHDYICIFIERGDTIHQQWLVPVNKVEKRDLVRVEYSNIDQAEFLFSKTQDLTFGIGEQTTIVEVKQSVQGAFIVNSEKITKDFYAGFRKQHNSFVRFITGINDELEDKQNKQKQWYASVMLDRLMFCYFIQKKGFLNLDTDYLRHKQAQWKDRNESSGSFFQSFYRGFLIHLFHEGLNGHTHSEEFRSVYGRIPYLNGGMFDLHQLEQMFDAIDISDEAFESLFDFFDQWQWHLDTRITASGKDINPDVLGYIFEQYINDRAAMGAYYTKEDITEYIGKNCILPFLLDEVRKTTSAKDFLPDGYVWRTLRESTDRYVYEAVKHGHTPDWQQQIPTDIAQGIDTTQPDLLRRRAEWNKPAQEPFALPTEIWRETVERLQRCDSLLAKIAGGEVKEVNDLITLNLDIRELCYDLLQQTDDHLFVEHFYHAMQQVTILDPTCGSGAFLFAAMNILEPLYDLCITRMEDFHQQNPNLFRAELDEINSKYRSNRQYFIYKSIILRNLYGVDIMAEAVEIAKLRLFLKMVAVVDVNPREANLGLDPLPDIDFNIRCGNTLVGYATEKELDNDLNYGDMFAREEFKEKIDLQMDAVARIYGQFKHLQLTAQEEHEAFQESKQMLKKRLAELNDLLNHKMYASEASGSALSYEAWLSSHQPFHWLAEFYQIIQGNGGFDVIIGNPPYLEQRQIEYEVRNYQTRESNAVHAYCIERSLRILSKNGVESMIVPLALVCTQRMQCVQKLLESGNSSWYSNYAWRPAKLFDAVNRALSIFIVNKGGKEHHYTSPYIKWISDNRTWLFEGISYTQYDKKRDSFWMPKLSNRIEKGILDKILSATKHVINYSINHTTHKVYYRTTGGLYWKVFTDFAPAFFCNGIEGHSSRETSIGIDTDNHAKSIVAFLSSNTFWWWYTITSNLRDLNPSDIQGIKFPADIMEDKEILNAASRYLKDLKDNSEMLTREQKGKGTTQTQSFKIAKSKPILDQIDTLLAKHYGFTDEELDFIINYDIKYRMGDELNCEG